MPWWFMHLRSAYIRGITALTEKKKVEHTDGENFVGGSALNVSFSRSEKTTM